MSRGLSIRRVGIGGFLLVLLAATGCQCGSSAADAGFPDAGLVFSPAPSWWDLSDDGSAVLTATTAAGVFQLRSTFAGGSEVLAEKVTAYGAIQVERVRSHNAFIVSGLNPNRVPVLYTAFVPGKAPLEFFACASTSPASAFSAGGADSTGFWIGFDSDCASVCAGRRASIRLSTDGALKAGSAVCNGASSPFEARRVLLHQTQRLLAEFEVGATRLVRFDDGGVDSTTASAAPQTARFTGFLPDAPSLLAEEMTDAGTVLVEYSLADAGLVSAVSGFADAGGRVVSAGGAGDRALVLVQGPIRIASREQVWRAMVRRGARLDILVAVTELGAQVRAVALADGGVAALAGMTESDGGSTQLRVTSLRFAPAPQQ